MVINQGKRPWFPNFGRWFFVRILIVILLIIPKFFASEVHEQEKNRYEHSRVHQVQSSDHVQAIKRPSSKYSKEANDLEEREENQVEQTHTYSGAVKPDVIQDIPLIEVRDAKTATAVCGYQSWETTVVS
jgi:inner membrane protein involved in colicin E2 resistance